MRYTTLIAGAGTVAILLAGLMVTPQVFAGGEMPSKKACKAAKDPVTKGGCVMTDRKKGNCMGCHKFKGLEKTRLQAGNVAPPLVAMKQRYPGKKGKKKLYNRVFDATKFNKNSSMPPFGRHKILKKKDIENIVEFLYTL